MKKNKILIVATSIIAMALSACSENAEVTDYPEISVDTIKETTEKEQTKTSILDEEHYWDVLKCDMTKLNPSYTENMSEEEQNAAREILACVAEGKETLELSDSTLTPKQINNALSLAGVSSPIMQGIYIMRDNEGNRKINYIIDNPKETYKAFAEKISGIIDENVNPDDSELMRIKAMYGYLMNENEFDVEIFNSMTIYDGNSEQPITCKEILNNKIESIGYEAMTRFIFTQLDIQYIYVLAEGELLLKNDMLIDISTRNMFDQSPDGNPIMTRGWYIFTADGKQYNCDPLFEGYSLYEERRTNSSASCEFEYFAMSDETRKKSFDAEEKIRISEMSGFDDKVSADFTICENDWDE